MGKIIYGADCCAKNFEIDEFGEELYRDYILPGVEARMWSNGDQFGFSIYLINVKPGNNANRAIDVMQRAMSSITAVDYMNVSSLVSDSRLGYSYGFAMTCGDMNEYDKVYNVIKYPFINPQVRFDLRSFYELLVTTTEEIQEIMNEDLDKENAEEDDYSDDYSDEYYDLYSDEYYDSYSDEDM